MRYELKPVYDSAKSFYGKSEVVFYFNEGKYEIFSYNTLVMTHYKDYYELNYDYFNTEEKKKLLFSNTTLRHIKEYLRQHWDTNINITKQDIINFNGKRYGICYCDNEKDIKMYEKYDFR